MKFSHLFTFVTVLFGGFNSLGQSLDNTLGFIENKGQIYDQNFKPNPDVKYILPLKGMNVQLKTKGFSYDTYLNEFIDDPNSKKDFLSEKEARVCKQKFHRVDIEFLNSNSDIEVIAEGASDDYLNFYNAVTPEQGATFIHQYKKIIYKNIYDRIDIEFIAEPVTNKPIEYNFILHPGADINDINVKYTGANSIELKKGKLVIELAQGTLTETIPLSFWQTSGKPVNINYSILSQSKIETLIGYSGINKPIEQTLIIDPTPNLDWGTYYGDWGKGQDICADSLGNLYVIGYTYSFSGIATTGAFQTTTGTNQAAFITKFNKAGVRQWGTYYSGTLGSWGNDIAVDQQQNISIIGTTQSSGLSSGGAYQVNLAGSYDAFIAKFDPFGVRIWGTYYGGVEDFDEQGISIAADKYNNYYVTGISSSSYGISTPGSYQPNNAANTVAYLSKFDSNGNLQWGTYIGNSSTYGYAVACDTSGNIYVGGNTLSYDMATLGAHQDTAAFGQGGDGFVMKFDYNGQRLWGTYLGSYGYDIVYDLCIDLSGNVYCAGQTDSGAWTYFAFNNPFQPFGGGYMEAFVVKLRPDGTGAWGTYLGGNSYDAAVGIAADSVGNVYVTGTSGSPNGICTSGAYQTTVGGTNDAFIVKYDSVGNRVFGTYYGGSDAEKAWGIAVSAQNDINITGISTSQNGVATPGAHQEASIGDPNTDGVPFITKFSNTGAIGINQLEETKVENDPLIFPNPNNGEFIIKGKEGMDLKIINALGQLVQSLHINTLNNFTQKCSLSEPGFYFILGTNKSAHVSKKIIVTK